MRKDRSYRIALVGTAAVLICGGLAYFLAPHFGLPGLEKHREGSGEETVAPATPDASTTASPSPSVLASASPAPAASPTAEDHRKLQVLDEILKSKNDNDPRLDTDFRNLTPAAKQLMREHYAELAPEKRNERGTIVFILGKNLSTPEDFAFLGQVISEQPCLGLEDCSKETHSDDPHAENGMNVTLSYPQMVTLYTIQSELDRAESGEHVTGLNEMRAIVDLGVNSQVREVASKATELRERLKNLKS